MTNDNQQSRPAMVHAVRTMPRWKWRLLGFAFTVGCIGVGGEAASYFLKHPVEKKPAITQTVPSSPGYSNAPAGSSGFVSGQPVTPTGDSTPSTPALPASPTITDLITPFLSHFGFSLFVGVIVGLVARTFIRMAILITALIVGGAMALSYFNVNVDLNSVRTQASQATSWLSTEGDQIRSFIFNALPSSTAASVGFLFGFKKR